MQQAVTERLGLRCRHLQFASTTPALTLAGHAPMTDLWSDKDLGRILLHFHNAEKPTASLCHGPAALLSTMVADKGSPWAYNGYEMTCYSNTEEMTNELMFGSKLQFKVHVPLVVAKDSAVMFRAFAVLLQSCYTCIALAVHGCGCPLLLLT